LKFLELGLCGKFHPSEDPGFPPEEPEQRKSVFHITTSQISAGFRENDISNSLKTD